MNNTHRKAMVLDLAAIRARLETARGQHWRSLEELHAMTHALGNVGTTVLYTDPVEAGPVDHLASLRELVADMEAGLVDFLVIVGGTPVYTAPADFRFGEHLSKVKLRIRSMLSTKA
jgi:hypothetical protein